MSAHEKRMVNERLAEVARAFGLKFMITVNNAQKVIEDNYKKIREIDRRIQNRVTELRIPSAL